MSQQNSLPPFTGATLQDLLDTLGVTQFTGATEWFQVIGGLIIQGGFVAAHSSTATVTFATAFPKQILTVIVQPANSAPTNFYVDAVTLEDFVISHGGGGTHDYYWFAIGV